MGAWATVQDEGDLAFQLLQNSGGVGWANASKTICAWPSNRLPQLL